MALLQKAYLGATPLFRNTSWFEDGALLPVSESSADVTVTANSTAHTAGSWVELIASTAANTTLLQITARNVNTNNTNTATLLDIGTGASGSESALISNIGIGGAATTSTDISLGLSFAIPIKVASGTRLSARIRSVVTGGKTAAITLIAYDMGDYSFGNSSVDVIGTSTTTSAGTAMTGASGTWVQVTASTSAAYRAIAVIPSMAAWVGTNMAISLNNRFTLGKGASGSEVELGQITFSSHNVEAVYSGARSNLFIVGTSVPSGTRLAIKHNLASTTSGNYGVTLIGIP